MSVLYVIFVLFVSVFCSLVSFFSVFLRVYVHVLSPVITERKEGIYIYIYNVGDE